MQPEVRSQRPDVRSQETALRPQTSDLRLPRPLLLAGPTAVGKSEVALRLADQLGGEIISVDSMQVYRGLDIGTAKPSLEERQRVPHHLIDVVDLTESFDAAQFARLAHQAVEDIQARRRVPILCGGSGLYFKAFIEGLGDAPPADETLRAELQATPLSDLLRELEARDPATFEKIDRQNPRRVIRAIEVIRLTGKPFSTQRAEWSHTSRITHHAANSFCLARESANLRARIDARVDTMFREGLIEETRRLLDLGLAENETAMQSLGYRQAVEHLRGVRSLAATVELVKVRTRQFAKRQMTWFRRQLNLEWIELEADDSPARVAGLVKVRSTG
ncbi:MAG: tRNA (adenosine(37)-N6)-dimethylallyltransferase MiaA [Verrucomicrobia bacterium]|nr:tRNA (adenosine(37)-N6)-dimethylallyltransferase MiaA [Verrucomicrobiota bacterium]